MKNIRSKLVTGAAVGAAVVGGTAVASATTSATTPDSSTTQSPTAANRPAHGAAAHENAEKPVTGSAATKAEAAAVKAAGSGTATEVTTDFRGNGYEVTVKKSDGSTVEIHLDSSFNVVNGRDGHSGHPFPNGPAHGTAAHENAEKPVTGSAATKAEAAGVKAAGSGTATEVTTDFRGNGYEVTVKKSDGSTVEIRLDSSFNVVSGRDGHQRSSLPAGSST